MTFSRVFSQLVGLFPLKRGKRDVQAFASSFGKSFQKLHLNDMGCIGRGVCLVLWCVFVVFVCMHECVRCVYVCMYVCMHTYMHIRMYMHICMHKCMHTCMHVCMHICMHVCMHLCMHICMHIYVCTGSCLRRSPRNWPCICVDGVCVLIYVFVYVFMHVNIYVCMPIILRGNTGGKRVGTLYI